MTDRDRDLARRAVGCGHWRWMPGMLALDSCNEEYPARVIDERRSVVYEDSDGAVHEGLVSRSDVPDLADPATLGALLALVRVAWGDPHLHAGRRIAGWGVWTSQSTPLYPVCVAKGDTEAEALVAALEAAP